VRKLSIKEIAFGMVEGRQYTIKSTDGSYTETDIFEGYQTEDSNYYGLGFHWRGAYDVRNNKCVAFVEGKMLSCNIWTDC
jgi:hypothetical protein